MKITPRLLCVQINLTNICPWRCSFCQKASWPRDHLKWKILSKLLHDLNPDETTVILSGGDPSLYPKIGETLQLLNKLNFNWGIFTTGVGWREEDLEELAHATWIRVSVLSDDSQILKTLVGKDSLSKQKKFIHAIQDRKANVSGECTVVDYNKNNLPTEDFWQIKILYYSVHEKDKKIIGPLVGDRNEPYILPYFHALVDPSGDIVNDCCIYDDNGNYTDGKDLRKRFCLGNLNKNSINEIFYSKKAEDIRKELKYYYHSRLNLLNRTQRYAQKNRILYEFLAKNLFL